MTRSGRVIGTVFRRDIVTMARTPGYWLLTVGFLMAILGFVAVGGGGRTGFVPAIADVLVPMELLVPLTAVLLGYRAFHTDLSSGEFAVIRTYPVSILGYVLGTLFARVVALTIVVGLPLTVVGAFIWATAAPDTGIYATHSGVDSPLVFVRFLVFTLLLAVPYVVAAAAVAAVARSRRGTIVLAATVFAVGATAGDLAVLRSISVGEVAVDRLPTLLALTPNTAFRGLVFEHVIGVAFAPEGGFIDTDVALVSLLGWTLVSVVAAIGVLALRQRVDGGIERIRTALRTRLRDRLSNRR